MHLRAAHTTSKVNTNPCDPTIPDEFLRWNKAGGKVLAGLTRRRKAERIYMDDMNAELKEALELLVELFRLAKRTPHN